MVEPVEPGVLGLIRLLCLAVAQSGCPNWTLVQGKQPSRVIISYDTLGRHIPLTGWRAIPVFFLTENVAQLSRERNPRLEKMIKSKYYVITPACAKYSATLAISSRLIYYPPICTLYGWPICVVYQLLDSYQLVLTIDFCISIDVLRYWCHMNTPSVVNLTCYLQFLEDLCVTFSHNGFKLLLFICLL